MNDQYLTDQFVQELLNQDDLSLEEQEQLKYDETYEKTQQLLEKIREGIFTF